jgi:hypothetical protein
MSRTIHNIIKCGLDHINDDEIRLQPDDVESKAQSNTGGWEARSIHPFLTQHSRVNGSAFINGKMDEDNDNEKEQWIN